MVDRSSILVGQVQQGLQFGRTRFGIGALNRIPSDSSGLFFRVKRSQGRERDGNSNFQIAPKFPRQNSVKLRVSFL